MNWTWMVYGGLLLLAAAGLASAAGAAGKGPFALRSRGGGRARGAAGRALPGPAAYGKSLLRRGRGLLEPRLRRREQARMDMEIYEGISFLRNLTVLGKGGAVSADYVLEQLAGHRALLQPVYSRTLHLLRLNQKREANLYFSQAVGTPIGRDFARLLMQWDEIDPKELLETLLSHQKNIKEIRTTAQKRRNETVSDLIYLPVVINVMLVFINFIYIAYFIDQREMLTMFL